MHLRTLLTSREPRHRRGFWMWMAIAPLTAPFMLVRESSHLRHAVERQVFGVRSHYQPMIVVSRYTQPAILFLCVEILVPLQRLAVFFGME